jgi:hypothetical protein
MPVTLPTELQALDEALDATGRDAAAVVDGLSGPLGAWRSDPGSWSVAECIDHLATADRVYLVAMEPSAARARETGRHRRGPAVPGIVGGWFVRQLEPPVTSRRMKAPRKIRPRTSPPLNDAVEEFQKSHAGVRAFVQKYSEIDLAGVHFPNPFISGLRFSLATGLHVIAAHERRHLWQAWRVRRAAEQAR